jgi:hypothetical protein
MTKKYLNAVVVAYVQIVENQPGALRRNEVRARAVWARIF